MSRVSVSVCRDLLVREVEGVSARLREATVLVRELTASHQRLTKALAALGSGAADVASKKRGRPSKVKAAEGADVAPKKRGRPPKAKAAEGTGMAAPKKRGRPPKVKPEAVPPATEAVTRDTLVSAVTFFPPRVVRFLEAKGIRTLGELGAHDLGVLTAGADRIGATALLRMSDALRAAGITALAPTNGAAAH